MSNKFAFSALLFAILCSSVLHAKDPEKEYEIQLDVVSAGFDKKTCWVHPRAGIVAANTPGNPQDQPAVVLTMNKLLLAGMDAYFTINSMRTDDLGKNWSEPTPQQELARIKLDNDVEQMVCDFWPSWHAASGKLLGIGHTVKYKDGEVMVPRPRRTGYSVYDPVARKWGERKYLEMPDEPKFENAGGGSVQRYDLPNGDILLPISFKGPIDGDMVSSVTIVRVRFDGETMEYIEHGSEHTLPGGRGLSEPSLTKFNDRYYMTIRNDEASYVTCGDDGLHFDEPKKWTFDDGQDLGTYNTQQHWVTHSDALYLVYTRRGANNDHVFRHRAPLFMAKVDPERLCVLRDTERVLVPEKGARLGNFGVTQVSPDETWVTTAEWMQTTSPRNRDWRIPMKYGSDNRVYVARIKWKRPNELVQSAP